MNSSGSLALMVGDEQVSIWLKASEKIKPVMLYKRIYGWQKADILADIPLSIAKLPSATHFPESIFMLDKGLCFQSVQWGKDERRNSILLLGQRAS